MKLYATVTSERASKGQGGNERLVFHITGEDRDNDIAVITVFPWKNNLDDGIPHICANVRDDIGFSLDRYTKGEKQKGEKGSFAVCSSFGCGRAVSEQGAETCDFH